ncbi:hypothetical protein AGRA3207_007506 [Actinomadura graeca]|uniref:Uncharacterized protein n=1 Tax=Actinomadura graeca TaxID=2750812 RepID=A0ABX8R4F6_9ACTN|nr:hypothetical protein [Actinomadura graeca]QXJ25937.1 hypothetical protein AGRA3207_007506 [Actinomadura graeca]
MPSITALFETTTPQGPQEVTQVRWSDQVAGRELLPDLMEDFDYDALEPEDL